MPSTRSGTITSVERAFAVLRAIAQAETSLGVSAIARVTDLPKSTTVRLLHTLESLDVVERVSASGGYRTGSGLAGLAQVDGSPAGLRAVARPFLRALVEEVGEDAGLAVPDGDRVLYVDQHQCDNPVQVPDWSGERLPYHAVAAGFVLLAGMDEADVRQILGGRLDRLAPGTMTSETELRRRVARARREGVAWAHGDWSEEIVGVAAPVVDAGGHTVGAVNLFGPSYRFPGARTVAEIERRMIAAARRISEQLAS